MDRFLSNVTNRVDAKGRVSIPGPFRAVLARDGFEGLFIHPALDVQALDAGGNALLTEIDGLLSAMPAVSEARDQLSMALYGVSEVLKVDPEGRMQLSENLKAYAGIGEEVTFVGLGHKFQLWRPERFRAHLEGGRERLRELKRTLSGQGDASPKDAAR
jgi:MraZ protein